MFAVALGGVLLDARAQLSPAEWHRLLDHLTGLLGKFWTATLDDDLRDAA